MSAHPARVGDGGTDTPQAVVAVLEVVGGKGKTINDKHDFGEGVHIEPVPEGELYLGWLECRICGDRHHDVWSVDLAPWEAESQECPVCGHKACGVSDDQSCDES